MKWIVILGMVLFAGAVMYWSVSPVQTQCEVCLEFDGELVCLAAECAQVDVGDEDHRASDWAIAYRTQ